MVALQRQRQLPVPFDKAEMGRRFKEALDEAGWKRQEDAVRAIRRAVPGTGFSKSDLSALVAGYKLARLDRMIAVATRLGLDIRILFPEFFDPDGKVITRPSHPHLFRGE